MVSRIHILPSTYGLAFQSMPAYHNFGTNLPWRKRLPRREVKHRTNLEEELRVRVGAYRQSVDSVENQAERVQVLKYTEQEAREKLESVRAFLGAIRKDKLRGIVTAQLWFHATHGIAVNTRTSIRDQERAPIAADLNRAMREKSEQEEKTFALTADVSEVHREVSIAPEDWHMFAFQVQEGPTLLVNTVGTFGMASASYYRSRVAAALGRLSLCFAEH